MSHHPYAYGHHNPLYRAGTVGDVPTSAQTVTVAQCQSAYYHGALAATQGITVEQGLNTLAELFPPGVIDPDQCIAGTCSLEELKACYRRGYDETKNPPAFYATDKGQTGLLWGGILGLLAGIAGTYAYFTYVAPGFVEMENPVGRPEPLVSKKGRLWQNFDQVYMQMRRTFEKGDAWTAHGGRYAIEGKGRKWLLTWEPPPGARTESGRLIEGYVAEYADFYDAVYGAASDFYTRVHEGLAY